MTLGLVADPGPSATLARRVAPSVEKALARLDHRVRWKVEVRAEPLTLDPDGRLPVAERARTLDPGRDWDFVVCLTDLPRHEGRRTVLAEAAIGARAAMISLPALGFAPLRGRLRATITDLVTLVLDPAEATGARQGPPRGRRFRPIRREPVPGSDQDVRLVLTGWRGHTRLLLGMVRDNRPWRLVPSLSKAIAAASAAAAFGIFYPTIWAMADALSPPRLAMISMVAVTAMVSWLIVHNGLWERPHEGLRRARAGLFNLASVLTLYLGVGCMYAVLFTFTLVAATAVISGEYLETMLRHPVTLADYATLSWLSSSLGTIAGALGSSLETEEAIHRAAYSKRERQRRAQRRRREDHPGTGATLE
ncbi:hypothetical protein GCM10023192_01030 [Amycolatopsis samaneae]